MGSSRCPIHNSSARSDVQASAAAEPSISSETEFFRPAEICEIVTAPRVPSSKRTSTPAASSLVRDDVRRHIGLPGGHAEGYADTFRALFADVYVDIAAGGPSEAPTYPTIADGHRSMESGKAIAESHRKRSWVEVAARSGDLRADEPHRPAEPDRPGEPDKMEIR